MTGSLGTVDRSLGFVGRHFFHEIVDFHVVHHLFPQIPFYHAEEATVAIKPLLGKRYLEFKSGSYLWSLYDTFRSCRVLDSVRPNARKYKWSIDTTVKGQ